MFGLWLNLPRLMLRQAVSVAQGVGVAFTRGRIDRAFFDAMALCEEETDELEFRTLVERSKQAALQQFGGGHGG